MASRLSCGRDIHHCTNLNGVLDDVSQSGYDFVCVPLVNPRFKREFVSGPAKHRAGPLTRSDLVLTGQDWSSLIVAKFSPWIDVDSENEITRKNSEKALKQELQFASHLGVPAITVNLKSGRCNNLVRMINTHLLAGHSHQYWLRIPLKAPEDDVEELFDTDEDVTIETKPWKHDTWQWWNKVRNMCDSHKKLSVSLEITADLPSEEAMERWFGEPIKSCFVPTNIFLTNRKGFPVLSRAHQLLIRRLLKNDVQMIVTGSCKHPDKGIKTYQQYLAHLHQTQDPLDNVERFAKGYEDYLQSPLQPLMDNLESGTYEVFEKDPTKYSQYQKAVYQALLDRVPQDKRQDTVVTIMVVGAGRGPLVTASLTAAQKAEVLVKIYAVEKNENAVVTLQNLQHEVWGSQVTIVSSDMRVWQAPEKADILVSELLGSFSDNELSPECLDGAQKFLKHDGISIPCEYTSYIAPICSQKLWTETRACKDSGKSHEAPFECPYVVRLQNVNILSKPQPLFTFHHPNWAEVIDNSRMDTKRFTIPVDSVMHGIAGYFDSVLYGDVTLSIVPETHSPGMFSWFPIYFPILEPVYIRASETIEVTFWRMISEKNVWYEWCVTEPVVKPIHNPKGRSHTIGL